MKKNKVMRFASCLLVLAIMTTCAISATFAKYITSANGSDSARVAKWGFNQEASIGLTDLFKIAYDDTVNASTKVIAPGTSGSSTFQFAYNDATAKPEVKYTVSVSTEGSSISDDITKNTNIKWALDSTDDASYGTWSDLLKSIAKLSGADAATVDGTDSNKVTAEKTYDAGNLPAAFSNGSTHTVYWKWVFNTDATADSTDTSMGNKTTLDTVTLKITITATQVD